MWPHPYPHPFKGEFTSDWPNPWHHRWKRQWPNDNTAQYSHAFGRRLLQGELNQKLSPPAYYDPLGRDMNPLQNPNYLH